MCHVAVRLRGLCMAHGVSLLCPRLGVQKYRACRDAVHAFAWWAVMCPRTQPPPIVQHRMWKISYTFVGAAHDGDSTPSCRYSSVT